MEILLKKKSLNFKKEFNSDIIYFLKKLKCPFSIYILKDSLIKSNSIKIYDFNCFLDLKSLNLDYLYIDINKYLNYQIENNLFELIRDILNSNNKDSEIINLFNLIFHGKDILTTKEILERIKFLPCFSEEYKIANNNFNNYY